MRLVEAVLMRCGSFRVSAHQVSTRVITELRSLLNTVEQIIASAGDKLLQDLVQMPILRKFVAESGVCVKPWRLMLHFGHAARKIEIALNKKASKLTDLPKSHNFDFAKEVHFEKVLSEPSLKHFS